VNNGQKAEESLQETGYQVRKDNRTAALACGKCVANALFQGACQSKKRTS